MPPAGNNAPDGSYIEVESSPAASIDFTTAAGPANNAAKKTRTQTTLIQEKQKKQRDEMLERLGSSSLFARDLAGGPEWATGVVDRSAQAVRAAIAALVSS